jgi:hypothetical protein
VGRLGTPRSGEQLRFSCDLGVHPGPKAVRMCEELLLLLLRPWSRPIGNDDERARINALRLDSLTAEGAHDVDGLARPKGGFT